MEIKKEEKKKEYSSVDEFRKEYLPETYMRSAIMKTEDSVELGVLLARANIKDIKNLLEKE